MSAFKVGDKAQGMRWNRNDEPVEDTCSRPAGGRSREMSRLTARTAQGLPYLVNVKDDEQEVDSPHKNTLQCILDCFARLAALEDILYAPDGTGRISLDELRGLVEAWNSCRAVLMPVGLERNDYLALQNSIHEMLVPIYARAEAEAKKGEKG